VTPVVNTRTQVIGGGTNWRTTINGVSTDFQTIRDWQTQSGTFFTDTDVRGLRKVAVVGTTVAENLYPGSDPIGSQIQIRNVPFEIVGVLAPKGQNAGGQDQDDIVVIPYTTAQSRLSGNTRIWQVLVSATSPDDITLPRRRFARSCASRTGSRRAMTMTSRCGIRRRSRARHRARRRS
jgi:putative ABC transport system permease protein